MERWLPYGHKWNNEEIIQKKIANRLTDSLFQGTKTGREPNYFLQITEGLLIYEKKKSFLAYDFIRNRMMKSSILFTLFVS